MIAAAMTLTGAAVYWATLTGGESRWFASCLALLAAAAMLAIAS